jgi:Ala-tRNA(Pro) deacylase
MKKVDLDTLRERLGTSKLGPATIENLKEILDVEPGSVSLFSILHDKEKRVEVMIDEELSEKNRLAFHPNYNGLTSLINFKDSIRFLKEVGATYSVGEIPGIDEEYEKEIESSSDKMLIFI